MPDIHDLPRRSAIRRAVTATVVAFAVVAAACSGSGEGAGPDARPVIVDYSPTQSDIGALLYLLERPEVEVVAVTMPGTGESHCPSAAATTRAVLDAMGHGDVPVGCGPDRPLEGDNAFPDEWRAAADEMKGLGLERRPGEETSDAVGLLIDQISESDRPPAVLALGPLTNLGAALRARPDIATRIERVYVMGGAVDVDGNVFESPNAEWNIWVDPAAAAEVLAADMAITLIPLDATNDVPVDTRIFRAMIRPDRSTALEILTGLAGASPEWHASGGFYLWDELAAGVLVDRSFATYRNEPIGVVESGPDLGATRPRPGGRQIEVAFSADRVRFTNHLVGTWAGEPVEVYPALDGATEAYGEALRTVAEDYRSAQDEAFAAAAAANPGFDFEEDAGFEEVKQFYLTLAPLYLAAQERLRMSLAALEPPQGLPEHDAYIAVLEAQGDPQALLDALAAMQSFEDLDGVAGDQFTAVVDACNDLETAVRDRGLSVTLHC